MGLYIILGQLFLGYILGLIFGSKPFSFLLNHYYEQLDKIFFIVAFLITFGSIFYFWFYEDNLVDAIQIGIFLATFFTLLFSALIKDGPLNYRNRPKIKVIFDDNEADNYHMTKMENNWKTHGGERVNGYISTYYVRLRVENFGNSTLKNTQVILQKIVKGKLTRPFFPLNLFWGFGGDTVDIPPMGASKAVNIFEVMNPSEAYSLIASLHSKGGGPDEERYLEQGKGLRACSVLPNTLSDVFPAGKYVFQIMISADNAKPVFVNIHIRYDKNWLSNASLRDMRKKFLRVKVEYV